MPGSEPTPGLGASGVRAALFDLDGTLVDSAPSITRALNLALGTALGVETVRALIGDGAAVLVERALRVAGLPAEPAALPRFLRVYAEEGSRGTAALPGAEALLRALRAEGWALGLVTNKPTHHTMQILDDFGWTGLFGVIVAGDTLPQRKPAPEPLWAALRALGAAPHAAVMVGDSANDARAARAAGVPVVLVRGGYSVEDLNTLGADLVAEGLPELFYALPRILGLRA